MTGWDDADSEVRRVVFDASDAKVGADLNSLSDALELNSRSVIFFLDDFFLEDPEEASEELAVADADFFFFFFLGLSSAGAAAAGARESQKSQR